MGFFSKRKNVEIILILSVFFISLSLDLFIGSKDLDPYISISYSEYIYEEKEIPKEHPYLYKDKHESIANPYLPGYSLFLVPFIAFEELIFITPSIFAALTVFLVLKLQKKLQNDSIVPAVLVAISYPFLKLSVDPHPDLFCLVLVLSAILMLMNYLESKNYLYLVLFLIFAAYASITRYYGLLTILFFMTYLIIKKREFMPKIASLVVVLAVIIVPLYYLINVQLKDESLIYPVLDQPQKEAATNYKEHSWFPWMLKDEPAHALGHILLSFYPFIIIGLLSKNFVDKELFHVFFAEAGFILVLFPSFGGLDRYLLFVLPFIASSFNYRINTSALIPSIIAFGALSGIIAYERSSTLHDDFYDFNSIKEGDTVMFMEYSQLSYEYKCTTLWASQFYFEDFERLQTTDNFTEFDAIISDHGVDYIIIEKNTIVESHEGRYSWHPSESFYNNAKNYNLVEETEHYEIYSAI